jgi:hypothetical protein
MLAGNKLTKPLKRHVRPLLLAVAFGATSAHAPLITAVHFLRTAFQKGRSLGPYTSDTFPTRFIPEALKRYLYTQDTRGKRRLLPDRYEFLVYRLLRNNLEAGDLFCRDSVRFRSFEDDLRDDRRWQAKDALMADAGLALLTQPIRGHLAALERRLEGRMAGVNQWIAAGENEDVQITRRGPHIRWTLQYSRDSAPVNHPFFDQLRQVEIRSVVHFVHQQYRFMDALEHILGRYVKHEADERAIIACLLAWGTHMGLGKMGDIAEIGYHTLVATSVRCQYGTADEATLQQLQLRLPTTPGGEQ